jgi:hypothetical protein
LDYLKPVTQFETEWTEVQPPPKRALIEEFAKAHPSPLLSIPVLLFAAFASSLLIPSWFVLISPFSLPT